jgi:hypothetical protein
VSPAGGSVAVSDWRKSFGVIIMYSVREVARCHDPTCPPNGIPVLDFILGADVFRHHAG